MHLVGLGEMQIELLMRLLLLIGRVNCNKLSSFDFEGVKEGCLWSVYLMKS